MSRDVCYVKFKVGDRVVSRTDIGEDITPGNIYIVTEASEDLVYFQDDAGDARCRPARYYTKVKPKRDYVADHARRTLRKAGLSKEEARQVVENWDSKKFPLSALSRKLPDRLPTLLLSALVWSDSPQGWVYWHSVYMREFMKEQNAQAQ